MPTLNVDIPGKSYAIKIGSGLMNSLTAIPVLQNARQLCVVTNETIADLYLDKVVDQFEGKKITKVILPDGEKYKNLDTFNQIFDALLKDHHHRTTTLVALGGGVVGDMTGFAAACYQRGVAFVQVPTTLLSQVDSSVGGKTGVNHPLGKNMIGAFHQPAAVIIDTDVLKTLPKRELAAGLAEVIKYGFIADAEFFDWLEKNIDALLELDEEVLNYAIYKSCSIKADVVGQDEKEKGVRAHLNFGHTFGHAIENAQGYGSWLHGEAVGAGMVMALAMSQKLGWITEQDKNRGIQLIEKANLPITPPSSMTVEQFIELMSVDKKVLDGNIRLVLLKAIGDAVVTSDFPSSVLSDTIKDFVKLK